MASTPFLHTRDSVAPPYLSVLAQEARPVLAQVRQDLRACVQCVRVWGYVRGA